MERTIYVKLSEGNLPTSDVDVLHCGGRFDRQMKYLNPLKILLAGLSVLVVGYALTRTIWAPETEAVLNIPSLSSEPRSSARPPGSLSPAPERRSVGSRRISALGTSPRDPIKAPGQATSPGSPAEESDPADSQGAVAPAPAANAPAPVPPGSGATRVISTSTTPINTGREAENSPAAQPRSTALGRNRPARQPRATSRLPRGRAGLLGGEKRDRQDGPSSPPVRSSFPSQRLP